MVYANNRAILKDVYTAYCKAKLYVVNDKYTYKDFISKLIYDSL